MRDSARERLVVSGPLPPSLNNIYGTSKGGKRYLKMEARLYKTELKHRMMVDKAKDRCPEPPFSVHFHFRFATQKRRDISNMCKVAEDAIFEFLGYDDSLVHDLHVWRYIDRVEPGMTVEIRHCSRELEATA